MSLPVPYRGGERVRTRVEEELLREEGLVLRALLYRIDFIWNWGLTRGEYDRYRVNVKSVVKVPRSRFWLHSLLTTYNSLMFH